MSIEPTRATPGPAEGRRFDDLAAYRAIAALGIILLHAYAHAGAITGAAPYAGSALHMLLSGLHLSGVFFVLSGFLLFLPFARAAIERQERPTARGFLIRRLIRILPLYYLTLIGVWAWRFTGRPEQVVDLLLHLTFTHTLHPTYIFWTIGPAWSLAMEVHFYLFLAGFGPLAHRLCGGLGGRGQRVALIGLLVGLLILASLLLKGWAFRSLPAADWRFAYNLPARFDAFGLGMLLALLTAARRDRALLGPAATPLLQAAGLAGIAATVMLADASPLIHHFHTALIGLGATLLIGATALGPQGAGWGRALRLPALRFLGAISYGIYLLHEPILVELGRAGLLHAPTPAAFPLTVALLIALTIGAATMAHHLVERPSNELRHLFDRRGRLVDRYGSPAGAC